MLLNILIGQKKRGWTKEELQNYVNYLYSLAIPQEVLDAITTIYSNNDNYFDIELLDMINPCLDYRRIRKH